MISPLQAALPLVLLIPASQEAPALVGEALERDPAFTLSSAPAERDPEAVFGRDLEVVLDFGINGLWEFTVGSPDGEIAVRLLDMLDSGAAFGWFSHGRAYQEPGYEPAILGAEAYARADRVVFWQSRFLVELTGPREASLALGRLLSNEITGSSWKPPVASLLPPRGLLSDSERYVLTARVLESLGLDPELLGFDNDVEAAVADYEDATGTATLALFSYPTPQLARLHSEAWQEASGGAMPSRRSGFLFGIVPRASSESLTGSILAEMRSEFDVTHVPPPPDSLTIQKIVLTAFTWIGIALVLTAVAGMGFGGLRIYMKTRYPGSIFGGHADGNFVQLNIDQSVNRHSRID